MWIRWFKLCFEDNCAFGIWAHIFRKAVRVAFVWPRYDHETANKVVLYGLKFILKFLRLFGDFIVEVKILDENNCPIETALVLEYLNLYCTTSLQRMEFYWFRIGILYHFTVPFERVNVLVFVSCEIERYYHGYLAYFTSLRHVIFLGSNSVLSLPLQDLTARHPIVRFLLGRGVNVSMVHA